MNFTPEHWMREALALAAQAREAGEVPVGAIVVYQNEIIGRGYNQPIQTHDPTAHAEIIALRDAARNMGNYRLPDTTLYVTLEPCPMCAGAMVYARIRQLGFGARDPRAGAVCSVFAVLSDKNLNHQVPWEGGILADECARQLKDFFQQKRR